MNHIPHPGLTDTEWERLLEIDQKEIDGTEITEEEQNEAGTLIDKLTKGNKKFTNPSR